MTVTYIKRQLDGTWLAYPFKVKDEYWEAVFDLANRHFCGHLPWLPDPLPTRMSNG